MLRRRARRAGTPRRGARPAGSRAGGAGPSAIRISGSQLGLSSLFPGVPSKEAYAKFLGHVLARTAGEPLPSREALAKGDYPRFPDVAALNAAFYGNARG